MARAVKYKELDEVRAPESLPEIGIRAGDRGVVVIEHKKPYPAVEVEYTDVEGVPRAFVVYSPDLAKVFAIHTEKS